MSTFDDVLFHRPSMRRGSLAGWIERLLRSGAEPFDSLAAEAMIAAARAAFGQIEIIRSGTKLRYIAKGDDLETLGD